MSKHSDRPLHAWLSASPQWVAGCASAVILALGVSLWADEPPATSVGAPPHAPKACVAAGADHASEVAEAGQVVSLVGRPAPPFTLENIAGEKVALADLKGSVVVVDFWATWCGPCRESLPEIDQLYQELKGRGLKVFAVNEDESVDEVKRTIEGMRLHLPVLLDKDHAVSERYAVEGIPTTVVVGADGTVADVFVGAGNEIRLRAAVINAMGLTQRLVPATNLKVVDDNAITARIIGESRRLVAQRVLPPNGQLMRELREREKTPAKIPSVAVGKALPMTHAAPAADLYAEACRGTIVIAGLVEDDSEPWLTTASGFVVSASGVAVTNYHVIDDTGATPMVAMLHDGRVVPIRAVLASSRVCDIAVIQLEGSGFTPLPLADGAPVGADVSVLSHPSDHFYCLTRGAVVRYGLSGDDGQPPVPVMNVSADFSVGSSGGPVLDAAGRVVGMVSATESIYAEPDLGHVDVAQHDGEEAEDEDSDAWFSEPDLQMVFKHCVPIEQIIATLRGNAPRMVIEAALEAAASTLSR